MKNNTLFIAIFLFACTLTFAQDGRLKEKAEQVKALKVAFIANELALTAEEAAKFWPIYNTFDDRQKELRRQKIGSFKGRRNESSIGMTEKEASALLSQMESTEDELYQLRKKLVVNLKGIIPAGKILKLKKAEEDFSRKLLRQYRDKGRR